MVRPGVSSDAAQWQQNGRKEAETTSCAGARGRLTAHRVGRETFNVEASDSITVLVGAVLWFRSGA